MDRFVSIEAFVRVADAQSFAEAARQLDVAKSVVSERVRQLEEFIAAPLFHRTTRSVRLTEIGEAYYRECSELISSTYELVERMRDLKGAPAGLLRINALPGFVLGHLADLLCDFQDRYPGIAIDLVVNDAVIDPIREGFDCTIQIFPPASDTLVERRLFSVRRIFCASPGYLAKHGAPRSPGDLMSHRIGLYSRYPTRDHWVFHRGDEKLQLDLKAALRSNSVHLLRDYALADAAIVCIPTLVAADDLLAGRLQILLADFQLSSFWLSAVYPPSHRNIFKLRLFFDTLDAQYSGGAPWDKVLIERGLLPATAPE
jgi:DNA-binding transcriptional LysR family regulator